MILFYLIKTNNKIEGLNISGCSFLYSADADNATFILKNVSSVIETISMIDYFSNFSGLKSSISKCEIASIGALKGAHVAICILKPVDLTSDTVKILGVHCSRNKKIQNEENFCKVILDIQNILRLWRVQSLTIDGKITIFEALVLSKVVYLALLTVAPNHIIHELIKIQSTFIWKNTSAKIKHKTLILDHKQSSSKCADVNFKTISLQYLWLKRLFDYFFQEWKVIPLF